MKKYLFTMMALMMAVTVCVGFAACSDDDDEGSELSGTWLEQHSDYVRAVKFSGSTCWYGEWGLDEKEHFGGTGAKYTAKDGVLTITPPRGEAIVLSYSIDGKTLILTGNRDYAGTYTKK